LISFFLFDETLGIRILVGFPTRKRPLGCTGEVVEIYQDRCFCTERSGSIGMLYVCVYPIQELKYKEHTSRPHREFVQHKKHKIALCLRTNHTLSFLIPSTISFKLPNSQSNSSPSFPFLTLPIIAPLLLIQHLPKPKVVAGT